MLDAAGAKPALSWLRNLELRQLGQDVAVVGPRPGQRTMVNFLIQSRLDQIADLLAPVIGRRVRVTVDASQPSAGQGVEPAPTIVRHTMSQRDRQEALNLPLVRQVQDLFDVTPIEVRPASDVEQESESSDVDESPPMDAEQVDDAIPDDLGADYDED